MNILYSRESSNNIDEVGQALEDAATRHGFGILGILDIREAMRREGVEFESGCRIYDVCNPLRAKQVLEARINMATVLPCRIAVYEEAGATKVATVLPTLLLNLFHATELWWIANEVQNDIQALIDEAVG